MNDSQKTRNILSRSNGGIKNIKIKSKIIIPHMI